MPVALITAADGVCHPTSAALIIGRQGRQGRQGRRSIYPDRWITDVDGIQIKIVWFLCNF